MPSRGTASSSRQYVGTFKASHYTPRCKGCTGITASGAPATPGVTIAVDTKHWPLGTKFFIEGYGYVTAQDTGGAIKGRNRIDICVSSQSEALRLGIKNVEVHVITPN